MEPVVEIESTKAEHVLSIVARARFVTAMGIRVSRIAEGVTEFELEVRSDHLQQDGYVHAGVLATLCDHNAGVCAATVAPLGTEVLSIDFHVNLLRPAVGPKLWCQARALRVGKTIATVESEVWNIAPDGRRLVSKGTVTLALRAG